MPTDHPGPVLNSVTLRDRPHPTDCPNPNAPDHVTSLPFPSRTLRRIQPLRIRPRRQAVPVANRPDKPVHPDPDRIRDYPCRFPANPAWPTCRRLPSPADFPCLYTAIRAPPTYLPVSYQTPPTYRALPYQSARHATPCQSAMTCHTSAHSSRARPTTQLSALRTQPGDEPCHHLPTRRDSPPLIVPSLATSHNPPVLDRPARQTFSTPTKSDHVTYLAASHLSQAD